VFTEMAENSTNIKVVIADRQSLFRRGVSLILNQCQDICICGEVGSTQELFSLLNDAQPDVLLLDTDLSSGQGPVIARSIKQQYPVVAILLLTSNESDAELFEAIKSRCAGYLQREVSPEVLIATIGKAALGQHPINDTVFSQPRVAEKLLQQFQDMSWGKGVEPFVSPLTPRETEVLSYLAKGNSNKEIAAALTISEQTMKNHITSILRKLNANARTEAVIIAIKRGLITLS
jgi:DNA-binding NarL/FixJ family response regulator